MNFRLLFAIISILSVYPLFAQDKESVRDTVSAGEKIVRNRNIMLNASSLTEPRQISIGLPPTISSSIFEDGLPTAYYPWPYLPSFNWHSGCAETNVSVMSLGEAVLRCGVVNYVIDSESRLPQAGDLFHSDLSYGVNNFGGFNTDLSVYGNISKNWGIMGSAFILRDPGSNPPTNGLMQTSQDIFKIGVVHRWDEGRGKFAFIANYSSSYDFSNPYSAFYYHASSGTVTPYPGITAGKDYFLPLLGNIQFLDVVSGQMKDNKVKDIIKNPSLSALARISYSWTNTKLDVSAKFKTAESNVFSIMGQGLSMANNDAGYHYLEVGTESEHGQPFSGTMVGMLLLANNGFSRDAMLTAELSGNAGKHNWRIGLNEWWNHSSNKCPTSVISFSCESEPKLLVSKRGVFTQSNSICEYYDGFENKLALYASDDWRISDRLTFGAGLRFQLKNQSGENATATDELPQNNRTEGWSLKTGEKTPFRKSFFEFAAESAFRYYITAKTGINAEYLFNRNYVALEHYASSTRPDYNPFDLHMINGGFFLNTAWMELSSKLFYVTQSNYQSALVFSHALSKDVGDLPAGYLDSSYQTIHYGIQTYGWTTDVVFKPVEGLQIHTLFTLQNPKFKNLVFTPEFKDGFKETFDMRGNIVPGVPRCIIELNPSYSLKRINFWLSFRYNGRLMANMTNSLFHAGHWVSFGGIGYKFSDKFSLGLDLTNILNQMGATGSIPSASLLRKEEVGDAYENVPIIASFIRPFTASISAKLKL